MKIISADITGSLIINNQDVTTTVESSSIWSGSIASRVTNLEQFSSSLDATFATDQQLNQATASLSSSIASLSGSYLTTSASFVIVSGSYSDASGSLSTRVTILEQASSSLNTASGSFSTRITNNELTGSSLITASGSFSTRVTTIESKYATTGSNLFTDPQYVSQSSNAIGFTSTASLYTDGGLRVTRDAYVSGTLYLNNLTVFGTSSIQYATSSQLNVGTNIITVNTNTPVLRFGGLAVYDSGSTSLTGSILWDSEDNQWIYSNPSGSTYDSALFLVGPRNSNVLGNEVGINCNFLSKGNGMHHMTSSAIFDDGAKTCFYGSSIITSTGVGCFSTSVCAPSFVGGTVSGTTVYGSSTVCAPTILGTTIVSGSVGCFTTICSPTHVGGTFSGTTGTFSSTVIGTNFYIPAASAGTYGLADLSSAIQTYGGISPACSILFWTNNTERMRITSAGKVAINETGNFDALLNINTKTCTQYTANAYLGSSSQIRLTNGAACIGAFSGISLGGGGATEGFFGIVQNSSCLADFVWQTYNGSAYGERVRITSAGVACFTCAVAISTGFNASYGKLQVGGIVDSFGNDAVYRVWNAAASFAGGTGTDGWAFAGNTTDLALYGANDLYLYSGGIRRLQFTGGGVACFRCQVCTPQMYIDSTTSAILQVTTSTNSDCCSIVSARWSSGSGIRMYYHPNSAVGVVENTYQSASGQVYGDILFRHNIGGTQTTRLRLQADGGIACFSGTVCAGTLSSTGDVIAYASDRRLKDNIKTITNPIDRIKCINGVTYSWKDGVECLGFNPSSKEDVGVLAQEVQKVLPEVVRRAPFDHSESGSKSGENYLTVKYEKIVPLLIEAIKEQQCQIEYLKCKIG